MKTRIQIILLTLSLPLLYVVVVIMIGTFTNYKPLEEELISELDLKFYLDDSKYYSALIWNIGYAGLGAEMDFFYDGGSKVRDNEDNVRRNIYQVSQFLQANDTVDFILLQEVDENSKRSYGLNIHEYLNLALPEHFPFYAPNYKVSFVPVPLFNPMGRVNSGLLTFSKHIPTSTERHSFPGNYSWPKSLFMLDRCFMSNRFMVNDSTDFVLVNTHNSAYDDGSLRAKQVQFISSWLQNEDDGGSAFLVGGDWNQCPSEEVAADLSHWNFDSANFSVLDTSMLSDSWKLYWDKVLPTNRRLNTPYQKENSQVTIIDYFLASSHIEVQSCKTIDLEFANSDHQPVLLTFKIKSLEP
jgi:endonuclease/exonuclease/phosphatase family metal-dependent hydrolase